MRRSPSILLGALVGGLTVLAFTWLHGLLISDIWFNAGPMVGTGALCGACLVWSHRATGEPHTPRRWWSYLAASSGLLMLLGPVSLLALDARWTMAEMMENEDAFELLLPPTLPFLGVAAVVGAAALWLWRGRRPAALVPILITQVMLVFFVGHQFAFLGLVEMSRTDLVILAEFTGLTALLAAVFGAGVLAGEAARDRLGPTLRPASRTPR